MGQDCHPLQFLRELTQNAIESVQASSKAGEVIWDVDWQYADTAGTHKLCIIDTGVGMTPEELRKYINQLSSSSSEQSFTGNYGVGAKISAAPRNPAGVVYLSWKNGTGAMVHLWRDPATGVYGLKEFARHDGTFGSHLELADDVKPEQIKNHGTKVVLLGSNNTADTMQAPEGTPSPSRWVAKYLNTRYFRFPEGVTVKAREGWEFPRTDSKRNKLRTITGQQKYLETHAEASGTVSLNDAKAHWCILKDTEALDQESNYYASSGHMAALYQNELYEMATARAGTAKLQQFGVIFGGRQVVIYVEPSASADRTITTTTARTQLLINNEPLPWEEWAAEFREKMPQPIKDLMARIAAKSSSVDHSQSIRERLRPILDLFKVSRYRPDPAGTVEIDLERGTQGGTVAISGDGSSSRSKKSQGGGGSGGLGGNIYATFEKVGGPPGKEVQPDPFPKIEWISLSEGTRVAGDLEDRAARFIRAQNLLLINADFRIFVDMVDRWTKEYGHIEGVGQVIRESVRGWFEQSLTETVIGVQALRRSKCWADADIEKALSDESLTAAVAQRYHVDLAVRRDLGSKLGSLKALQGERDGVQRSSEQTAVVAAP
jgi:hypothetical protein